MRHNLCFTSLFLALLLLACLGGLAAAEEPAREFWEVTPEQASPCGAGWKRAFTFSATGEVQPGKTVSVGADGIGRVAFFLPHAGRGTFILKTADERESRVALPNNPLGVNSIGTQHPCTITYAGSVRNQHVVLLSLDFTSPLLSSCGETFTLEIEVPGGIGSGPVCSEMFAGILSSLVSNPVDVRYGRDSLQQEQGSVTRCASAGDVIAAGTDFLIFTADSSA